MKITERNHNESAKDYVVRQLIYNVVHLNLIPGQKLETPQLCELLHVSSNPIREAQLELAQINLLEIRPKVGIYVTYIDTYNPIILDGNWIFPFSQLTLGIYFHL